MKNWFLILGIVFVSACAYVPIKDFQKKKVVFAKEVVQIPGNFAPKGITESFSSEDPFVNIFVTIEWEKDSGAGVKDIRWEWITNGEVQHEVEAVFNFYDSPFYLTGNVRTDAMSIGKHTVKLYIKDELFVEEEFEIK